MRSKNIEYSLKKLLKDKVPVSTFPLHLLLLNKGGLILHKEHAYFVYVYFFGDFMVLDIFNKKEYYIDRDYVKRLNGKIFLRFLNNFIFKKSLVGTEFYK